MALIDQLININITQNTDSAPTTSTTVPLLLGASNPGWADGDFIHSYNSASDLLEDGFKTTSPEYLAAVALTSQKITPIQFYVGRRQDEGEAGTAQIDRFAVKDVLASHVYRFQYDQDVISYTSGANDTPLQILQGLQASFAAKATTANLVTTKVTDNGGFLVLTTQAAGVEHAVAQVDEALTHEDVQAAAPAQATSLSVEDLNAIQGQNDSWYALILLSDASDADIQVAAGWVQSRRKRLFANSITPGIEDSTDADNLAVKLGAGGFSRTNLSHCVKGAATEAVSAWVGYQLPQTPGTNKWALVTLAGQTPDKFSSNAHQTMMGNPVAGTKGRAVNIYTEVGGFPIMQMGTAIDGSFIDIGIGTDWLFFNLQAAVYQALITNAKIAYTDAGVAILVAAVRSVLDIGVANELIDGTRGIGITVARVADVPQAQRATRRAPTIKFSCVLQGAVHAVQINGTVAV